MFQTLCPFLGCPNRLNCLSFAYYSERTLIYLHMSSCCPLRDLLRVSRTFESALNLHIIINKVSPPVLFTSSDPFQCPLPHNTNKSSSFQCPLTHNTNKSSSFHLHLISMSGVSSSPRTFQHFPRVLATSVIFLSLLSLQLVIDLFDLYSLVWPPVYHMTSSISIP